MGDDPGTRTAHTISINSSFKKNIKEMGSRMVQQSIYIRNRSVLTIVLVTRRMGITEASVPIYTSIINEHEIDVSL